MLEQNCVLFNWNVRGLNNTARRQVVYDAVRDCKATIVTLQETKLDFINRQLVFEILGSKFVNSFVVLPAVGTYGGILLAVDEDHYTITRHELGVNTMTTTILSASGLVSWCVTVLMVKFRQPSHEFTFVVGMSFISYPLVLTPLV
jgi:exonuclease III